MNTLQKIKKLSGQKGDKAIKGLKKLFDDQHGDISAEILREFFLQSTSLKTTLNVVKHIEPALLMLSQNAHWRDALVEYGCDQDLMEHCTSLDLAKNLLSQQQWSEAQKTNIVKMMLIAEDDDQLDVLDFLLRRKDFRAAVNNSSAISGIIPFMDNTSFLDLLVQHQCDIPWNSFVDQCVHVQDATLLKWTLDHCHDFDVSAFWHKAMFVPDKHPSSIHQTMFENVVNLALEFSQAHPNLNANDEFLHININRWRMLFDQEHSEHLQAATAHYFQHMPLDLRSVMDICYQNQEMGGRELGTIVLGCATDQDIQRWISEGILDPWLQLPQISQLHLNDNIARPAAQRAGRKI